VRRILVVAALSAALIAVASPTALASARMPTALDNPVIRGSLTSMTASPVIEEAADPDLAILKEYVSFSSSGFALNAPDSVLASVPAPKLAALLEYMSGVEQDIAAGRVAMGPDGVAISSTVNTRPSTPHVLDATGSHGYWKARWFGYEVGMDGWLVNRVILGVAGAGSIATAIGGGTVAARIGPLVAGITALLKACQHSDGSVVLYTTGLTPPPTFWCA
jgi:hypothetical protein